MSDFDPDEIHEHIFGNSASSNPSYRATFRRGQLTVLPFFQSMVVMGPSTGHFRSREKAGAVIADLTSHSGSPGDELSVAYRARGRHLAEAEARIVEWAASVGFHRLWFPDRLVELAATAGGDDVASVKCTTCGQAWSDGGNQFWEMIVQQHAFPTFCPLCGADLPQWRLKDKRDPIRNHGHAWATEDAHSSTASS